MWNMDSNNDGPDWEMLILKKADGMIASVPFNTRIILRNHPEFCSLRYSGTGDEIEVRGTNIKIKCLVSTIQDMLLAMFNIKISRHDLRRRIVDVAYDNFSIPNEVPVV